MENPLKSISPDSPFKISLVRLLILIGLVGSISFTAGIALAKITAHEALPGHEGTRRDIGEIKERLTRIETLLEKI